MIDYKPKHGDMEMWLIVVAIDGDTALIDRMKKNADGSYPIKFEVGGVELDFSKIAKRVDESINRMVEEKAVELLNKKYSKLIKEIDDIQEKLNEQMSVLFDHE